MEIYQKLLKKILEEGIDKSDRTGTGTRSLFGHQMRFDLQEGFPLLTTKKIHFKSVAYELLWFLRGESNIAYLKANKVRIWDEWADEAGELGRVYGVQWRSWRNAKGETTDQISNLIRDLKATPHSRRLIVSAWNVGELGEMALPPCHLLFQFYVAEGRLSCMMTQRSADVFLGLPFNIASYALLTHMIAQVCDLDVGELIISTGDTHLYQNHFEQANLQLARTPRALPKLHLNPEIKDIFAFSYTDFRIEGYDPHPHIKASVSV